MRFFKNEKLKKHTSFKIGGPADYFCTVKSIDDIKAAISFADEKRIPYTILGEGTNLLVRDIGFRGLVINFSRGMDYLSIEGNKAVVGAGYKMNKLILLLVKRGFGGLEFLAGIPGSVGGAVVMNAGAWGKAIGKHVDSIRVIDHKGDEKIISGKRLGFGYRRSKLQNGKLILAEITLKLRRQNKKIGEKKIREYLGKRRERHPLGIPNCGSVFKNPNGSYAAALIEDAGCKGTRIGDAQVSPKHANFIINLGEAKSKDVLKLITVIKDRVRRKRGITLEPEVKIMVKSST
ncbi:MAG: UDP-N-acetylmuramate dehydrogenase [Candidatus Margulisiibacteriota bacterium]|nr:UDP-N-acetylmuramate dehydrogenase [Candidatus Margulisiibacteriota bacterium]